MWDVESILKSLRKAVSNESGSKADISFDLFDADRSEGIGKDGVGNAVLLLPYQRSLAFETEYATFEPSVTVTRVDNNQVLSHVAVLRCKINFDDKGSIEAVAALFLGLIDLQRRFGQCGDAIWQMKRIFEEGLSLNPGDEKILGLFGELLFIRLSNNISSAIDLWHSSISDRYDFSSQNFKVDVKSTFSSRRKHHFSSNQVPGATPERTYIASFILESVEVGISLSDLVELVNAQTDKNRAQKVHEVCLKTLGIPVTLMKKPQIDFGMALQNLRIYSAQEIPSPVPVKGVLSMEWYSELEDDIHYFSINDFNNLMYTSN